ncbi:MAG: MarR family transcriptional regulator, partial [Rhodocyclaceae bacterium]|nr:MarR family transcriptional regulator [Rhodocyclaceae bacterium]
MSAKSLPVIRELVRCYQAFEAVGGAHIRTMGLTPPQFDIIATLGNTPGMRFKELGEKTLVTKGTLTGIVDRLTEKGFVRRVASPTDGRSQIVQLTPA